MTQESKYKTRAKKKQQYYQMEAEMMNGLGKIRAVEKKEQVNPFFPGLKPDDGVQSKQQQKKN